MAQEGHVSVTGRRRPKKPGGKKTRKTKRKPKKTWQSDHEHEGHVADEAVFDAACDDGVVHEHEQPAAAATCVRAGAAVAVPNVTVATADAMQCGACFVVLSPPIFQCEVGHVVCSACRDKLEATGSNGNCHVCASGGVAMRGGFRRCHAMERLLDCIRVACPYAAHGCDATPPYHGRESHRQACPHAPCHCPGESCGFVGSMAALLDHFAGAHDWPCTTKARAGETAVFIRVRDGFNFLLLLDNDDHDRRDDGGQAAATSSSSLPAQCLFMLNVTRERFGRAISVLCIHPHASAAADADAADGARQQLLSTPECELVFSSNGDGSSCHRHYQSSVFEVVCADLSNGLPDPQGCFQFLVPNAVIGVGDDDKNSIQLKARIIN